MQLLEREFELIAKEMGSIPYIDMKFNLTFNNRVEIWIDCLPTSECIQNDETLKFLFLFEPNEITSLRSKVMLIQDQFVKIFSHDPEILSILKNSELFQHGGTWILPAAIAQYGERNDATLSMETVTTATALWACRTKVFSVSFVCGSKKRTAGHRIRRRIWDKKQGIIMPKKFVSSGVSSSISGTSSLRLPSPPSAKLLLFDNMFHIAIENISQNDYFTEKLLDCFLTFTIPIYWGCPNIGSYFDIDGIIHVNVPSVVSVEMSSSQTSNENRGEIEDEMDQIVSLLNKLTEEDYIRRELAMRRNYDIALTFINQRERMEAAINKCL